ncbi:MULTISPECIES: hypothetical protein [Hahella]|uniref:hypothetical protein n=1 Tax=Hahella TaxID=158481 RepID=UPI000674A727|nr:MULTISPECIES: hypothetical protein [Hahella]MBU6956029.1 hypothetical protein [Hahella sp. HN01]
MDKKQVDELLRKVKEQESTRHIHVPYRERMGGEPDFEVSYKLAIDPKLEGIKVAQGMRSDFLYDGDDPLSDGIHIIWPEFLDKSGEVIRDKNIEPPEEGMALMWIMSPESREKFHRDRIKVGTKGYWVVGAKRLAKVTVTKIIGLYEEKM